MTISKNINVLYITYDGLTDQLGQSQILPYLFGLSGSYSFTIISCEKPLHYKNYYNRVSETCKSHNITWIPLRYTASASGWTAIFNFYKLRKKVFAQLKRKQYSFLHCRSYFPALIALDVKHKFNIPYIFDMRGFWADERVDGKLWNIENILYRSVYQYFKKKELLLFREAAEIISLTKKAIPTIKSITNTTNSAITVIPCATDFSRFNPVKYPDRITVRKNLEINEDDTVLCYLGSTGTWYMLNEMLGFFRHLLKLRPDSIFLIITNDPLNEVVNRISTAHIPQSCIRITASDPAEVPKYLSAADFAISFIQNTFSKQASSPTKLGEFLAMGIPVVCNDIGDVKSQLEFTGGGICLENFSESDFSESVQKLITTKYNKHEIRTKAMHFFDLSSAVTKYKSVYKNIK